MTSTSKPEDGHNTQHAVTLAADQVEDVQSDLRHDEKGFNTDDIHEAALVDNPETAERPLWLRSFLSWYALVCLQLCEVAGRVGWLMSYGVFQVLGQAFVRPLSLGFIVVTGILTNVGTDLNNTEDLEWIISGRSIAASVATSLGGSIQDIFGRRYVILAGDTFSLAGAVRNDLPCL